MVNNRVDGFFDEFNYFFSNYFVNLLPWKFIYELVVSSVARGAFLNAFGFIAIFSLIICLAFEIKNYWLKGEYEGVEHGSSGWADGDQYEILNKTTGIIIAKDHYLTTDNRFINKNVLIINFFYSIRVKTA